MDESKTNESKDGVVDAGAGTTKERMDADVNSSSSPTVETAREQVAAAIPSGGQDDGNNDTPPLSPPPDRPAVAPRTSRRSKVGDESRTAKRQPSTANRHDEGIAPGGSSTPIFRAAKHGKRQPRGVASPSFLAASAGRDASTSRAPSSEREQPRDHPSSPGHSPGRDACEKGGYAGSLSAIVRYADSKGNEAWGTEREADEALRELLTRHNLSMDSVEWTDWCDEGDDGTTRRRRIGWCDAFRVVKGFDDGGAVGARGGWYLEIHDHSHPSDGEFTDAKSSKRTLDSSNLESNDEDGGDGDIETAEVTKPELVIEPVKVRDPPIVVEGMPVRRKRRRRIVIVVGLAVAAVIVAVVVSVSVTMTRKSKSRSASNGLVAPIDLVDEFRASLPVSTALAMDDKTTAQHRALQWLTSPDRPPYRVQNSPLARMTQQFVLATLYYATDGDKWLVNTGWLDPTLSECEWFGCNCTAAGWVQGIDLVSNQLQGPIPKELSLLSPALELLVVFSNELTGTIPFEIGLLTKLRGVNLQANLLTGKLPTAFGALTNLEGILIDYNALSGPIPTQLGQLTKMQILGFDENLLTGTIPTELGRLVKLQNLTIGLNRLSGTLPTELGSLRELVQLHFYENDLTGTIITELGHLPKLRELSLRTNEFRGRLPSEMGLLRDLVFMSLAQNQLTSSIPAEVANMSSLRYFDLATNQLNGSFPAVDTLTGLFFLSAYGNALTGRAITNSRLFD
jgi:hypothetical protein